MRTGRSATPRRIGVSALVALVPLVASTLGPPIQAAAQTPQPVLYEVAVAQRLDARRDDANQTRIPATSTRFFPSELDVHKGDVVRFYSDLFLSVVALLPPPYTPTTDPGDPHAWQSEESGIAYDYDDPWFFVGLDPDDDKPGEEATPRMKVNNRIAIPPLHCGRNAQSACPFPIPGAASDPVNGVLSSGTSERTPTSPEGFGGRNPFPTNLFVRIDAEPGTTIWATMLTALGMNMKINVVPDDQPTPDPASLAGLRDAQVAIDTQRVKELDAQYANYRVRTKIAPGVHRHEALAGIEQDGVTILQAYPRELRIKPGDSVLWRDDLLPGQYHTVSFPRLPSVADDWPANIVQHFTAPPVQPTRPPTYRFVCDLDTDAGSAPDAPQLLPWPLYCPGFSSQLEIEFPNEVVYRAGDGTYEGATDWENSGIVGAAPPPVPTPDGRPFELTFPVPSPQDGFRYACLLHPVMDAAVVVK